MGLKIIKPGMFDTVQDAGRYGLQHLGVNPGGAADMVAYKVANMLVGNMGDEAVIEMYHPAANMVFEAHALVALSGADVGMRLNGQPVPVNTPLFVGAGTVLQHTKLNWGCCCYLAVRGGVEAEKWAGSHSTNIKAEAGGFKGRKLQAGDVITFKEKIDYSFLLGGKPFLKARWMANTSPLYADAGIIRCCKGNEYDSLNEASKKMLYGSAFAITTQSDRMGYRLYGPPLNRPGGGELVSTGVTCGTVQLLPNGQLVVLMADHQTTGGYPRVAHVISADMPLLAQTQPGKQIKLSLVEQEEAENILLSQHRYLQQLQMACNLQLDEFLQSHAHH